jgi:hypothetical protein
MTDHEVRQWIPIDKPARALVWAGDTVVDPTAQRWGYPFDRALVSVSGDVTVLYAERGLKALVTKDGERVRELNRSYYLADVYDFPIALGRLRDGREVVAYCPDEYNVLQIEDLATGTRLTERSTAEAVDQFHSRLSFSADGRFLLIAGWLWHPHGIASVYDILAALSAPDLLDGGGTVELTAAFRDEITAACWLDDDRILVSSANPTAADNGLGPSEIGVWSMATGVWLHHATVDRPLGDLIGLGDRAITLYRHPALIDAATGEALAEWPELDTGVRSGSYGVTGVPNPVVALHPDGTRLAVAQPDHIAIIEMPTA